MNRLLMNSEYPLWEKKTMFYPDENFTFQYADYYDSIGSVPGITFKTMSPGYWFECSALEVHPSEKGNMAVLEYAMCHTEKDMVRLMDLFDETLERMVSSDSLKDVFEF